MRNYQLVSQFILRTPMLSWPKASALLALTDEAAVEMALRELFTDPLRRQAIYIASPDLHASLIQWLDNKLNSLPERRRLVASLAKYTLRMASRCTPFGLFAGVSVGMWAHTGKLVLHDKAAWMPTAALDAAYTDRLRAELMRPENGLRPYLTYYSNTSLYFYQGRFKYTVLQSNEGADFTTNTATYTPHLHHIINLAREGCSFEELLQALNEFTADTQESEHFLHALINHQILVPNLNASPNGGLYDQKVARILDALPAHVQPAAAKEFAYAHALATSGAAYVSQPADPTNMPILFTAAGLAAGKNPFHIDLHKPLLGSKLEFGVAASIRRGLTALQQLASVASNKRLEQFKERFSTRYENSEVALLELLDADSGIPYNSVITDFTPLLTQARRDSPPENALTGLQLSSQEAFLLKKLMACRSGNSQHFVLTDSDLKALPQVEAPQPDSLYAICSLVAANSEDTYSIHLTGASANAAGTFARFTHSNTQVEALAADIAGKEELANSGKLVAELVYLDKNPRIGNIAQRKIARKYEIPFIGLISDDGAEAIHLADLYVGLRANRFYFRSASHNQEVVIKLTSAHNHQFTHPVVHFLGDVQKDYSILSFSWGQLTTVVQHLPRVYYKDIILSLEAWHFHREDFAFLTPKGYKADGLQNFWRTWGIPQQVYISPPGSDNKMLVDIRNPTCREILVEEIKKHKQVVIHEFIAPAVSAVANEEGEPFVNELLAFFTLDGTHAVDAVVPAASVVNTETRFLPGSEWLYYKVYAGTKSVDSLLTSTVARLTKTLREEGLIDSWFFIRYFDPDYHLRFRLHVTVPANTGAVLHLVNGHLQPLVGNGTIDRVQLDTYVPEAFRYGATSLPIAEQLFHWDSTYCLPVLTVIQDSAQPEQNRWLAIAYSLHSMLNDFAVPTTVRLALLASLGKVYGTPASKSIAATYRTHKVLLRQVLQQEITEDAALWQKVYDNYALRSRAWQPSIKELLALEQQQQLQVDLNHFVSSVMHMAVNRMCLTKSNQHEHILYNLLHKYYTTEEVRQPEVINTP